MLRENIKISSSMSGVTVVLFFSQSDSGMSHNSNSIAGPEITSIVFLVTEKAKKTAIRYDEAKT